MSASTQNKLKILGFEDPEFNKHISGSDFEMQINPETYSIKGSPIEGSQGQSSDTQNPTFGPKGTKVLSFSFYLDSTGVVTGCKDVAKSLTSFNKLCMDHNGNIHTYNYLKVIWRNLAFKCRLESVDTKYLMFASDGKPIRAEVNVSFREFIDPKTLAKMNNNSSPDMTHIITVKSGDDLTKLCYDIYGDSKYYLQVAEQNSLIDFRKLVPGQKLVFPRLDK